MTRSFVATAMIISVKRRETSMPSVMYAITCASESDDDDDDA